MLVNNVGAAYEIQSETELGLELEGKNSTSDVDTSFLTRPRVHGKFLYTGNTKIWVRGVTYGTFRPNAEGDLFPDPVTVEKDFAQIASYGFNAVRTYTLPPRWLLDIAWRHGLYVMVGIWWEQFITFLDKKRRVRSIEQRVREAVKRCSGHPAVLAYALANEIPASIVRWYGRIKIEQFLKRLYKIVKAEDPEGLVTYVNFPTTEYLHLPFLDFVCFNVYLESQDSFRAYLARLQNIAGERPLILAEMGLDSLRNGEETQARVLDWQIRTVGAVGGAGAFAFAWTDEWYCGGQEIEDWDFGLTNRSRQPKPALKAVQQAFKEFPFPKDQSWPRISVVVCSYNGAKTIRDCLEALQGVEYPNYEVIVVNDGSTDDTESIAEQYPCRVISITPNQGLSHARNMGLKAATGDIVAYIDDDAYPDPHWLMYLAETFRTTSYAGVGGPNLAPSGDGWIAECVANAPGGPIHVLLDDRVAEHIPGCNMAFRKDCLKAIGGFDPRFRTAGDDVDICWRLQQRGWTLGFHPSAMVWHHRRNSVRTYWKQQRGYGNAESLLEKKWPEKYNSAGHLSWEGRLYGRGISEPLSWNRSRVYQGVWGSAPFQLLYQAQPSTFLSLFSTPEWNMVLLALALLSTFGAFWPPLLFALPLLALSLGGGMLLACQGAARGTFNESQSRFSKLKSCLVTAGLHLIQPLARLYGRLSAGLTPWRLSVPDGFILPCTRTATFWTEQWQGATERLEALEKTLKTKGAFVSRGGGYDQWDLHVRGGVLGGTRVLMAIEEHGAGKQFVRFRLWPKSSITGKVAIFVFSSLGVWAGIDQAWIAGTLLAGIPVMVGLRMLQEHSAATLAILRSLHAMKETKAHEYPIVPAEETLLPEPVSAID